MSYAITAAVVGAGVGYLGTKDTNDTQAKIAADTNRQNQANYNKYLDVMKDAGKPRWDERQEPYVFGGDAWIPRMPERNPDAEDYWTKMAGGGLPGVDRAAGPIGLDELMSMLSNGGSQQINDLLGWGTEAPPPLWTPGSAPPPPTPPQAPQAPQAPQDPPWWQEQMGGLTGRPGSPLTRREIGRIRHQQQIDAMPPTYSSLGLD